MSLQVNSDNAERLAVKVTCAADILQNLIETGQTLEALERRVLRYVKQANLLLAWRRGNAALRIVGSTVKTVSAVAVVASSFNPRLRMAVKVGQRLWRFGAGLKILSNVTEVLKELWQKGCRTCLVEFTKYATKLVKNVSVFKELVDDLKQTVTSMNTNTNQNIETPEQVWNVLSNFVSDSQQVYFRHIICIVMGCQSYSPLFDFAALITDPSHESNILQLMREVESLRFLEFVQESDSSSLIALGSFLHVTRELLDFLDGLNTLSDNDCVFLRQCLTKYTDECVKIKSVVIFLKSLSEMKTMFTNTHSSNLGVQNNTLISTPSSITASPRKEDSENMSENLVRNNCKNEDVHNNAEHSNDSDIQTVNS